MQTFTFYSYKGGTGRTLAVANVARYLSRFSQTVVAVDFDLEAPGLHYKLNLSPQGDTLPIQRGVVDYFHEHVTTGGVPESLGDYVVRVPTTQAETGMVYLMAAGDVPAAAYWQKLSQINWHEFFYAPGAVGVAVFLELKERIREEFNPGFLLIDARTGITEIGGVATTVLPDKVVVLLLSNRENLDGARAVLRSLQRAERPPGAQPVQVISALSRIPSTERPGEEEELLGDVTSFLNEPAEDLEDTLQVRDLFVLHSEPELQVKEALRIGGVKSPDESVLLRDYLRLFNHLIPPEVIRPHVGKLIEQAKRAAFDDPDGAQKELELLAEYGHPDAYRELLKFYRLRNISGAAPLRTAERLWDVTQQADEALLWSTVSANFEAPRPTAGRASPPLSLGFIERVWHAAGGNDTKVALALADWYNHTGDPIHAAGLLLELVENVGSDPKAVTRCLQQLRRTGRMAEARHLIEEHADVLSPAPDFVKEWVRFALETDSAGDIGRLSSPPMLDLIKDVSAPLAYRVLARSGRTDEADRLAVGAVDSLAVGRSGPGDLDEWAEAFEERGNLDEFLGNLKGSVPESYIERIRERFHFGGRARRRSRSLIM